MHDQRLSLPQPDPPPQLRIPADPADSFEWVLAPDLGELGADLIRRFASSAAVSSAAGCS